MTSISPNDSGVRKGGKGEKRVLQSGKPSKGKEIGRLKILMESNFSGRSRSKKKQGKKYMGLGGLSVRTGTCPATAKREKIKRGTKRGGVRFLNQDRPESRVDISKALTIQDRY